MALFTLASFVLTVFSLVAGIYFFIYERKRRPIWITAFCLALLFFVVAYLSMLADFKVTF